MKTITRIIIYSLFITFVQFSHAQVKNNGVGITVTSGSTLVISGLDYINQTNGSSHGDINLAGSISLDGDWTNNATGGQLLDSTATAGQVIFNGTSTQTISGRETHFYRININSGANVDVSAGDLIKVYDTFTNNGNFTLNADASSIASLIDAGTSAKLTGNGNYKLERYFPAAGWHYVSSPITKSTSSSNIFTGAAFYSFNEPLDSWTAHHNNEQLDVMKGYDLYYISANPTITFSGLFNTGAQSVSLTRSNSGYNLVGNPYPCTVDWDASGWTKTNLDDALYIWDASLNSGQGAYMQYVGGVGNNGGSQYIPPTQAFFVRVSSGSTTGALGVSNSVKVNKTTIPFRKSGNNDLLRIKVKESKYECNAVLCLNLESTNDFDKHFDALFIAQDNKIIPQLYTFSNGVEYAINSIPEIENVVAIPLNYKPGRSGESILEFEMDEYSTLYQNYDIYLEDLQLNKITDLKQQNIYHFESDVADEVGRFLIHLVNPLKISQSDDFLPDQNGETNLPRLSIATMGKEVLIKSDEALTGQVRIFDIVGHLLVNQQLTGENNINFTLPTAGIYLLNYVADQKVISQKFRVGL